jgi:hypothetical protein
MYLKLLKEDIFILISRLPSPNDKICIRFIYHHHFLLGTTTGVNSLADDNFKDLDEYEDSEVDSDSVDEPEETQQPKEKTEKHTHVKAHEAHKHSVSSDKHKHHHTEAHAAHHLHHEARHTKGVKSTTWLIVAAVVLVIGIGAVLTYVALKGAGPATPVAPGASDSGKETVQLDFYVMSQCPYGVQVEDGVKPALDKLGNRVKFSLNFIASDNGDGTYNSLHGQNEVQGDIVQLCAAKYNPDKYMGMVVCMNKDSKLIPSNWEQCAKDSGLMVEKIRTCYTDAEGKSLLTASIAAAKTAGAQASPTMFLNGAEYNGGRGENDFLRSLCNAYTTDRPEACASIPPPTKVDVIILSDKRCAACDTTQLEAQLQSIFPGMVAKKLDYGDAEGKKLYSDLKLTTLPALLFDDSVTKDSNYGNIANYLVPTGAYQSLKIGATFDPTAEICDNGKDDDADGKVDCEDSGCTGTLVCREEKKKNLQVFVMSDCPYGKLAITALNEVVENFNNQITFEVHYIASETADGFTSLHGTYESDEDIVQLCVKKYSPAVWLDYLVCRSTEGIKGNDWNRCANDTGVAVSKVKACAEGSEGKSLLSADIKIAEDLGIGASPTWLANNKYQFSGIYADPVKTSFCQYNAGLSGCDNTLTGAATGSQPSGNCG